MQQGKESSFLALSSLTLNIESGWVFLVGEAKTVPEGTWGSSSGEVPRGGIRKERASWVWQHGGCGEELWKDSNLSFKGEDKKGNLLRIQRSFCSYRLLPWETSLDWEQGRKKGCAMYRHNEQGWDLSAISMFHLAGPTFLYPAVVCCPTALTSKFKSALGVLECFEQKVKPSPSHFSEYLKVLSQFRCGHEDFCAIEGCFSQSYVTKFILIPNWEICRYVLLRTFGLQKSWQSFKAYGGYEIEANNLNIWSFTANLGLITWILTFYILFFYHI